MVVLLSSSFLPKVWVYDGVSTSSNVTYQSNPIGWVWLNACTRSAAAPKTHSTVSISLKLDFKVEAPTTTYPVSVMGRKLMKDQNSMFATCPACPVLLTRVSFGGAFSHLSLTPRFFLAHDSGHEINIFLNGFKHMKTKSDTHENTWEHVRCLSILLTFFFRQTCDLKVQTSR